MWLAQMEDKVMCLLADLLISFPLTQSGQAHRVSHFHLLNWGPNCEIDNPYNIITVISCVMQTQRRNGNTPIVVHCRYVLSTLLLYSPFPPSSFFLSSLPPSLLPSLIPSLSLPPSPPFLSLQ